MKTKTINAQNWTGEKVTFSYDENNIEVYGYKFQIKKLPGLPEFPEIPEFEHYKITDEAGVSFVVTRRGDEPFVASTDGLIFEGYDLHRVIAVMIANLY